MASRQILDSKEQLSDLQEKNLKERIELSINYFFDLPTDPVKLQENVSAIKAAFQLELKAKDSKGDDESYFGLQKVIANPEEFFEPLDKVKPDVTNGEIQTLIVKLATQYIEKTATEAKLTLSSLGWDESTILTTLKTQMGERFNHPFKASRRIAVSIQLEPETDQNIYRIKMEENLLLLQLQSILTIDLGKSRPLIIETLYEFESINELANTVRDARIDAIKTARKKALACLKISETSTSINKLVTHAYYFNLFKTNPEIVEEVRDFSLEEAKVLLWPSVVNLLKKNKINIAIAKNITEDEVRVFECSFYYQKIMSSELSVQDFLGITQEKSKTITSPNITQLIQLEIITLKQAMRVSASYRSLLQCEYYFKLILNGNLRFRKLRRISSQQSINLTTPIMINLISNQKKTLQEVCAYSLSGQSQKLLKDNLFLNFFQRGMIDVEGISALDAKELILSTLYAIQKALYEKKTISLENAFMIVKNPLMMYLIQEKLLKCREIPYILPNSTEQVFPRTFDKAYNFNYFRDFICKFIELAKEGMVIEEDLISLYLEDFHTPATLSDAKEEKPTSAANPLLNNPKIRNICIINLQYRLNNILHQTPQFLHNNEIDTLAKIENSLMALLPPPINLWAEFFGVSLLTIYHNNLDGMQDVQKKMDKIKSMVVMSFSQFKDKIFMHFLHSLNFYFAHSNLPQSTKVGSLASTLTRVSSAATLEENMQVISPPTSPWQKALSEVIQFSNDGLSFHSETSSTREGDVTKKWKPSLTFFPGMSESTQVYKNIAMLCEMLNQLDKPTDLLALQSTNSSSRKRKDMNTTPRLLA